MSTQFGEKFEETLLEEMDTAFAAKKAIVAAHLVEATRTSMNEGDWEHGKWMERINQLPHADPIFGYFLDGMCVEKHFICDTKVAVSQSPLGKGSNRNTYLGTGPRILACKMTFPDDLRSHAYRRNYSSMQVRTVFYYEGDEIFPKGLYYREHIVRNGKTQEDWLVLRNSTLWIDPSLVPVEEEDIEGTHLGLYRAFLAAYNKDQMRDGYYID